MAKKSDLMDCMICAPNECTCNAPKKKVKAPKVTRERDYSKSGGHTSSTTPVKQYPIAPVGPAPGAKPAANSRMLALSDEDKLLAYAMHSLKPLLKQSEITKYSGIIPEHLPVEYSALAWRSRRNSEPQ